MQLRKTSRVAVLAVAAMIPIRANADEMLAYGVANFGGPGQCTNNSSHSLHLDTPNEFAEVFQAMMAAGKWNTASVRLDMAVRGSLFTDPSKTTTCTKSSCSGTCSCAGEDSLAGVGADSADVVFLHTHGSHKTDSPRSSLAMGNFGFDCSVATNQNMLWNGNADIAVIKACQSADREVWQMGGYASQFTTPTGSLTVWNGFHGDSSCSWAWTDNNINDYGWASQKEGVGENWLDQLYIEWPGSSNDDCPVSIVIGDTAAKRDAMFRHGGWRDRKNTGLHSKSSYFFIADCAPDNGIPLPSN